MEKASPSGFRFRSEANSRYPEGCRHRLERRLRASLWRHRALPGEVASTIGGNVSTNAGGMNAIRCGVTRHQIRGLEEAIDAVPDILGLEVLPDGLEFMERIKLAFDPQSILNPGKIFDL